MTARAARRGAGATLAFPLFLLAAAALHAVALAALAPLVETPPPAEGPLYRVRGADPELAALIAAWNTPPETGAASELDGPGPEAPPPDTTEAARVEAEVEAQEAVEDLGPVSGPGKEARRPIFAPPPKARTAAPAAPTLRVAQLSETGLEREVEPMGITPPALGRPSVGGADLGIGGAAADGEAGGGGIGASLGGLDGGGAAGFALPDAPVEESFAPETAPLPPVRPASWPEPGPLPPEFALTEAGLAGPEPDPDAPVEDLRAPGAGAVVPGGPGRAAPAGPGAPGVFGGPSGPGGPALPGAAPLAPPPLPPEADAEAEADAAGGG